MPVEINYFLGIGNAMDTETLLWIGIAFCISQSAMFSGLNLAFFSLSRLQLEMESKSGNKTAQKILALREDSNFLLTTILWGNVSINVLLTLLSDSALAGIFAFMFSTIFITIFGRDSAAGIFFS
jgi:metal transporter CNNM